MESIHKLEVIIEGWLKPLPHLPADWRKWISENVWWITLIGVIVTAIGVFGLLSLLSLFSTTTSIYGAYWQTAVEQTHTGLWTTSIYISVALLVLTAVIEAMAISPLKTMSKKGWDLLFLAGLVGVASGIVGAVLVVNVSNIISTVIGAIVGVYFLFEIRSHFKSTSATKTVE